MQHEVRHDNHSVKSSANCCPLDWTFKPAFGVVHAKGCSVCTSYMTHLIVANDSNNDSFRVAIRDRECLVSTAFLDGAQNGRQLQQEYDVGLDHRKELENALQSLEQHQKLLDTAKQEIRVLQDRTLALQMQLDGSVPSMIKRSAKSDPLWIERLLLKLSEDADYLDSLSSLSSTADKKVLPITPDPPTLSGDTSSVPSFSVSHDSLDSVGEMNSSVEHGSQPSKPRKSSSTHTQRPEPTAPNHLKPMPEPKPTTPVLKPSTPKSFSAENVQEPSTDEQLQALIDAAHAGDASALKWVKRFSASAYQTTPVSARTKLQHYVVKHWRKVPRPASVQAVGGSFHKEIYVDASPWGIGFVMDGMWSAWKFCDSVAHSNSPFNICWAEMVAVEVGLLTVIHWVTTRVQNEGEELPLLKIDVRCDNFVVVKAIEKRYTQSVALQGVLQRISEVIRTSNVQLSIEWIAGKENPADGPSRGGAHDGMTRLPLIPSLPPSLSSILNPLSTNE